MNKVLENLKYAKSHEWVMVDGDIATIGITDYAQHTLGSIVYLDASEVGSKVKQNKEFGVVESVKAASDLISPISGEVIEVNSELITSPELLNEDAFAHWIIKVKVEDLQELNNLLDHNEYQLECK